MSLPCDSLIGLKLRQSLQWKHSSYVVWAKKRGKNWRVRRLLGPAIGPKGRLVRLFLWWKTQLRDPVENSVSPLSRKFSWPWIIHMWPLWRMSMNRKSSYSLSWILGKEKSSESRGLMLILNHCWWAGNFRCHLKHFKSGMHARRRALRSILALQVGSFRFFVFCVFLVFFHIFFSMFLLYAVPTSLTEAWFPADSAILRSGAKETLHGKGCCSSHLSGNHILNPSFSLLLGDGGSVIFFVFVSPFWKLSFLKIRCSFGCLWICRCCWPSTTSTPMILWLDLKPQWKLDGLIDMSSCDHLIIVQLVTRDLKWQLRCTVTSSWRTSCMKRRHAVWFISSFPCSSCFF